MFTTKDVKAVFGKPWWTFVKNEVARVIAIRVKTSDVDLRPHGSMLGQMFIETMNEHPDLREYVHYLSSRSWEEILWDIEDDLSEEMAKILGDEEGKLWFLEFQKFLVRAWKKSIAEPSEADAFTMFDKKTLSRIKTEWILHLKEGKGPALLSNQLLDWMKDGENPAIRKPAVSACTYTAGRSWPEILKAVSEVLSEDLSSLDTPEAAAFYEKFKAINRAAVGDFFESLLEPGEAQA